MLVSPAFFYPHPDPLSKGEEISAQNGIFCRETTNSLHFASPLPSEEGLGVRTDRQLRQF